MPLLLSLFLQSCDWLFPWPFRKVIGVSLNFKTLQWKYGSECHRESICVFFSDADLLLTVKYLIDWLLYSTKVW